MGSACRFLSVLLLILGCFPALNLGRMQRRWRGQRICHQLNKGDWPSDPRSAPQNVNARLIGLTQMQVVWDAPEDPHGVVSGYKIFYTKNPSAPITDWAVKSVSAGNTTMASQIQSLDPTVTYSVRVQAVIPTALCPRLRRPIQTFSDPIQPKPQQDFPFPPTQFRMTQVTSTSVTLEWKPANNYLIDMLGYEIFFNHSKIKSKDPPRRIIPPSDRYILTDLVPNTSYLIWIAAKSSNKLSDTSAPIRVRTKQDIPPSGPVTNLSDKFITANVVLITWSPPLEEHINAPIQNYLIIFGNETGNVTEQRIVSEKKAVFTSLQPNQDYTVKVIANTTKGGGPHAELQIKTQKEMAQAPRNIQIMATSNSSVEVWWEPVPYRRRLNGYLIFYTGDPSQDLETWNTTTTSSATSVEIHDLENMVRCVVAVCAITKTGPGLLSQRASTRFIPVPANLALSKLDTDTMTLTWLRPTDFQFSEYKVSYDAYKEYLNSEGMVKTVTFPVQEFKLSNDKQTLTLNDLSPFTTYNINITAVPADGRYRAPSKIVVTTDMSVPPPMISPSVCNQQGRMNLLLNMASEEFGPISHYFLVIVPQTESLLGKRPSQFLTNNSNEIGLSDVTVAGMPTPRPGAAKDDLGNENKLVPYIAALFTPLEFPKRFQLGYGETYSGYQNKPLEKDMKYKIFLRAVVDDPDKPLFTSSPFSNEITADMKIENKCEHALSGTYSKYFVAPTTWCLVLACVHLIQIIV